MLGSGSVHSSQSQQLKLSAGELRRPRQASLQVCVSLCYAPIFWRALHSARVPYLQGGVTVMAPLWGLHAFLIPVVLMIASPRSFGKHISKEVPR